MEEIKNGEYVRTSEGYILENTFRGHKGIIEHLENGDRDYIYEFGKILKHSKNIIDLIEKDDIVNGYRVIELIRLNSEEISVCVYKNKEYMHCEILKEKDIKTILTKERYESNCYEVEE